MNVLYAKAVLYSYPCLKRVAEQIDELVEKRALASMSDFSPCEEQCEKIISYTYQKDLLFDLKIAVREILAELTEEERKLLCYKYFGKRGKEFGEGFDASSRKYFRNQIKVAKKFATLLEKSGFGDTVMEEKYLKTDFFKALYRKVLEHELKSQKNKKKSEKLNIADKTGEGISCETVSDQMTEKINDQKTA